MKTLGETGPAVEVPLDGTIYDLETGKVSGMQIASQRMAIPCTIAINLFLHSHSAVVYIDAESLRYFISLMVL